MVDFSPIPHIVDLQKTPVSTTVGVLDVPFGNTRLHIVKLLVTLLSTENATINEKLVDLGTFHILLVIILQFSFRLTSLCFKFIFLYNFYLIYFYRIFFLNTHGTTFCILKCNKFSNWQSNGTVLIRTSLFMIM